MHAGTYSDKTFYALTVLNATDCALVVHKETPMACSEETSMYPERSFAVEHVSTGTSAPASQVAMAPAPVLQIQAPVPVEDGPGVNTGAPPGCVRYMGPSSAAPPPPPVDGYEVGVHHEGYGLLPDPWWLALRLY
jgi:hypothetical protein